jgi:DtxR family transcriptional regulator, Mn-dependent transcriptional regulator
MLSQTSPAIQDYLKAVYVLESERGAERGAEQGHEPGAASHPRAAAIPTTAVAQRLGVSAASTTNMLKKLAGLGLVRHAPYRGAELTDEGRKIALEVIRHHRLLETYLAEVMGVPWDEVHAEAEVLEHVLSERLEDRIAHMLGDPEFDPHGHPIPAKDGSMPSASTRTLWDVEAGGSVAIDRVSDDEPEALRYLARIGVKPGAAITVLRRGPIDGPVFIEVEGSDGTDALSKEVAQTVWVR